MNKINKKIAKKGKVMRAIGIMYLFCAVFSFLVFSTETPTTESGEPMSDQQINLVVSMSLITGSVLTGFGTRTIIRGKRYLKYLSRIQNSGITSIDQIAQDTSLKRKVIVKDLEFMYSKGYLKDIEVDFNSGSIATNQAKVAVHEAAFAMETAANAIQENLTKAATPTQANTKRTVVCKNCSAQSVVVGNAGWKCEYCGTHYDK